MTEQTTAIPQPAVADTSGQAPRTGGFAPQVDTHPVGAFTLGRQNANDSDKSNYFEAS
ncbi:MULTISPECIES: hypothetical protein [Streptomyces]|uniref:hypothetical protein n=1 Tax=Streptomyces TaxID=1883 RepID=UPI000AD4458E|nr:MULTISPECIES: hypothetical protein [Streptomyces]